MKMRSNLLKYLARISYSISPKFYITLSYLHNRGRLPNLSHPKDLSEIIFNQILSGEINNYTPYVDKIKVREHIKKWGYGEYLPKLYGIWNSFDEIDFDSLPHQFVLKTNNGCGHHYFCTDKKKLDIEIARKTIDLAMNSKFALVETQYHGIPPLIYCEEFIVSKTNDLPLDYKFMCCDGDVRCVLLCSERSTGTKLSTYSLEWEEMDLLRQYAKSNNDFEKPINFGKMINIASDIASKFIQVRVDFYNIDGRIYIGELTFTPEGGVMKYFTNQAISFLGQKL